MCIILVYRVCTWILNGDYFTFCYSSQLQGIVREYDTCKHDYFSSFMLIILFERLSSLLFTWIILSQLWNTQRNYVLSEKLYLLILYKYFIWIENIESFHADWQSCITCSSCGAQPNFLFWKQEWSIFTIYYIIEIDYLIIYKILNDMFMIMQYGVYVWLIWMHALSLYVLRFETMWTQCLRSDWLDNSCCRESKV